MLTAARHPLTQVAAVALALGAVSTSPLVASGEDLDEPTLVEYEAAFVTHAREVGMVIEVGTAELHGMKPSIGPIERGELAGDRLRRAAEVWEAAIGKRATALDAVKVPARLDLAHERALAAYSTYQELARTLGSIADEPGTLTASLDRAVVLGARGDEQFDTAAAVIQDARRRLGLEPQTSLPDPDRSLPEGVRVYDPDELYPEVYP